MTGVKLVIHALLAGALCLVFPAEAQIMRACKDDMQTFCKDITGGGGRVKACLSEHMNEISEPCRASIGFASDRAQAGKDACGDDVKKFCSDAGISAGPISACLAEHYEKLSPQCKARVGVAASATGRAKEACGADSEKLCPGLSGRKARACLKENEANLSQPCALQLTLGRSYYHCSMDAANYCGGIKPGGGRLGACLKENESSLSSECRKEVGSLKQDTATMREACADDAKTYCGGLLGGRRLKCLRENHDKLSEACQGML